jgi:hypothetical protein
MKKGDRCEVSKGGKKRGLVKFVGKTDFQAGWYVVCARSLSLSFSAAITRGGGVKQRSKGGFGVFEISCAAAVA